jgi:hypothetical protein
MGNTQFIILAKYFHHKSFFDVVVFSWWWHGGAAVETTLELWVLLSVCLIKVDTPKNELDSKQGLHYFFCISETQHSSMLVVIYMTVG